MLNSVEKLFLKTPKTLCWGYSFYPLLMSSFLYLLYTLIKHYCTHKKTKNKQKKPLCWLPTFFRHSILLVTGDGTFIKSLISKGSFLQEFRSLAVLTLISISPVGIFLKRERKDLF